jgi:hypothetical protein
MWGSRTGPFANGFGLHRKATSLVVVEARAFGTVELQEDSVLFGEVVDHVCLVAIASPLSRSG